MKKFLPFVLCFCLSVQAFAQIEIAPATSQRPSLLRSWNGARFNIGTVESGILSFSTNQRMGLGTEYTSSGLRKYVNYGKFHLRHNSSGSWSQNGGSAHLVLDESQLGDYARLRFTNSFLLSGSNTSSYTHQGRFWDIAAIVDGSSTSSDKMNIYNSESGNILTVQGDKKIGINDSSPERSLDINGTARVKGYTETGNTSIPYQTKLFAFTSPPLSCSNNTEFNFDLGVNENRVVAVDVLVRTGSSSLYGSNDRANNREYHYRVTGNKIYFTFGAVSNCLAATRTFRVWLTYTDTALPASFIVP